jgi:hypothetical protein
VDIDRASPPAGPAAGAPIWEDFVEIFFSPGRVFARRRDGRFWPALVVLTLVSVFLFFAMQNVLADVFRAEFERELAGAAAEGVPITVQPTEEMRRMGLLFGTVALLVVMPIGAFLIGLVIWVFARLFGSAVPYGVAVAVAVYSEFPALVQGLTMIAQGLVLNPTSTEQLSVGPGRFLDREDTPALLFTVLHQLDVFVIWSAVLMAIGLYVAAGLTRGQAATVAAIAWLLGLIPTLVTASMG